MKLKFFQLLFICLISLASNGQELLPFVENFTKSEYNGDNQVWNVVQGSDNAMYFANNHYFLRYNGVKWEKYTLPNKTIIRSVFIEGDKIYCGSYKEFGYWKRIEGKMKYFSLSKGKEIFNKNSENEEVWKIFRHKDKLYFQTFNEVYIYSKGNVEKVRFPSQISYCYVVENEIYAATVRNGIYKMNGNRFSKILNWEILENNVIHHIEKHNGEIYFFTKNSGIFKAKNGQLLAWNHPLNSILKNEVIVTAKFADKNTLVVGSGLQGIYIVNLQNGTYKNLNRQNALRNNAVLSIGLDSENDIWLGLDNGICHVEINSPVTIFSDNSGVLGSVYSLSTIGNGYLFVTNHGIFNCKNKKIEVVPNSQGQVWDIYKAEDKFIIGHNDGTFVYDGTKLQLINPINGGWKFLKSNFENVYFQAHYAGIVVYKDVNDLTKWKFLEQLPKPIRNIAQNKPGELWAADNYKSLYRIQYDSNFVVKKVENVSQDNGITNDYGVKIFSYKNEILFLINNSWHIYNPISGKLEKDRIFNSTFKDISDIIPIDDERFIVFKNSLLYVVTQVKNEFLWELIPEKYYAGRLIIENIKVYKNNKQLLINLDDGFISFEINKQKRKIHGVNAEGFYGGKLITKDTNIKHNQPVEINVVTQYYGYSRPDLFYKLNNSEKYIPIVNGHLVLNNLNSGSQKLDFYYNNGKKYIKLADYEFNVDKPWYFSIWMVLLYVLIITISFFLYYRWNKIRYSEKIKLKEEELKHQKEIIELELIAENKLKLQEYEKHILEIEIQNKAYEVAGKSLSIAKQSEMIDSIQQILETESDVNQIKSKIKKSIKINALNKNEWESFEHNLMQSNEDFVSKLSKNFPVLTSKDIKLCIYLKMNLSSKEIAPLMNISFRGVELHRYRLRKKLGLNQEESLSKFMINI